MKKSSQIKLAVTFGTLFVVAIIILAIAFPEPSDFQYTVFRIVLALAAAGIAACIPGFLKVTVTTGIQAGGAMAVFVIVYFFSPAAHVSGGGSVNTAFRYVLDEEDLIDGYYLLVGEYDSEPAALKMRKRLERLSRLSAAVKQNEPSLQFRSSTTTIGFDPDQVLAGRHPFRPSIYVVGLDVLPNSDESYVPAGEEIKKIKRAFDSLLNNLEHERVKGEGSEGAEYVESAQALVPILSDLSVEYYRKSDLVKSYGL